MAEIFWDASEGLGAGGAGGATFAIAFAGAAAVPFFPEWAALPLIALAGVFAATACLAATGAGGALAAGFCVLDAGGAGLVADLTGDFAAAAFPFTGLELLPLAAGLAVAGAFALPAALAAGFDLEELDFPDAESATISCCLDMEFQPATPRPLASFANSSRLWFFRLVEEIKVASETIRTKGSPALLRRHVLLR